MIDFLPSVPSDWLPNDFSSYSSTLINKSLFLFYFFLNSFSWKNWKMLSHRLTIQTSLPARIWL